jgi:hypothetical protein
VQKALNYAKVDLKNLQDVVLCFEDQVVIEHIYQALENGRHLCCCLSFFNSVGLLFFFQSLVTMGVFFFQVRWHCACIARGATDRGDNLILM